MKWVRVVLIISILSWGVLTASAQYYSWGADHSKHKWSQLESSIDGGGFDVIYSDSCDAIARRVLFYLDNLEGSLGEGFTNSAGRFPVVMHPENFISNGMAMWMPARVEFISTPSQGNYSTLWLKQLSAHEYRHVVQYDNMNQGFIKALSYILGEQGSAVGFAFLPLYGIEGDAVMFETQTVSFGRALQPSFSMAYRAIGRDVLKGGRYHQKWFAGSYREHIPNHYELGYQLTAYGYTLYGVDMWDRVFDLAARKPYIIATTRRAMRKYYDTTIPELFDATFENLNDYWDALPQAEDYAKQLSEPIDKNYTIYSHPLYTPSGDIVALKEDFDNPSHFVLFDRQSGEEQRIKYTGVLSSRPDYAAGRLWWSEYRRSLLFSEKWDSRICYLDIESGKGGVISAIDNALYPTPIGDSLDHYAYVEYQYAGHYSIVEMLQGEEVTRYATPYMSEIQGLAWDDVSDALYVIVTTDDGMWLGACRDGAITPITSPAYITLSDLRASGGNLYFGSISSGRDELHSFDISSGEQRQLTSSSYGAFDSSRPNSDGDIALTTYDRLGYHLSTQREDILNRVITPDKLPLNIVNPERAKLDVINLDTLRFTPIDSLASVENSPSKRFRKGRNIVNIHSWAPVKYNPYSLSIDDVGIGATILSQNLLATSSGYLSYGWSREDGSAVEAGASFWGLGLQFDFSALWSSYQKVYSYYGVQDESGEVIAPLVPSVKSRYSVSGAVTLPLYFSGGYMSRSLYLSSAFSLSNDLVQSLSGWDSYASLVNILNSTSASISNASLNSLIEDINASRYSSLLTAISFNLSYSQQSRMGYRDIYPRLGYYIGGGYKLNPTNSDFSSLVVALATAYLPGAVKNHSLRLSASYQTQVGGFQYNGRSILGYQSSSLIPTGYTTSDFSSRNFFSTLANYSLPICYPNIGIPSFLFIKRLRANLGVGYARYDSISTTSAYEHLFSYGGDLSVDFTAFRLPDASTTSVTFSVYKPRNMELYYSFGMSLPF